MKKILLLIDMQNGFCKREHTTPLAIKIKDLLEKELFDVVIATRFINSDDSAYERFFDWDVMKSEEEIQLIDGYEDYIHHIVDKSTYSCINDDVVEKIHEANDNKAPEQIFLAGVDTDACVLASATGLFDIDIRPVVLVNYCASNGGSESHDAGIICLERLIGKEQLVDKEINVKEDLEFLMK